MTTTCLSCLEPTTGDDYHPKCLKLLFGRASLPSLSLDAAKLHVHGLEMAGHVALSGVQRKVALRLTDSGNALEVAPTGSRYILKPSPDTFPNVPENEHLSMRLAERFGIEIPPLMLMRLSTGKLGLLVKRFDRTDAGRKRQQEDFCQLSFRSTKDRYQGSAEQLAKVVKRFASEPVPELLKLFRTILFSWWVGNGDLHLKNLSLLRGEDGRYRLSPAYDVLSTEVVLGDDALALSVGGKRKKLTRRTWLEYAESAAIPKANAEAQLNELVAFSSAAERCVEASFLPPETKAAYWAVLARNSRTLRARGASS